MLLGATTLLLVLSLFFSSGDRNAGNAQAVPAMLGLNSYTAADVSQQEEHRVIPLGRAVGIKLFSDGVLVVGLSPVETEQGAYYPGRDSGLKAGDIITHIDGEEVDTIEEIQQTVVRHGKQPMTIQAMRGERQLQLTTAAVKNSQGIYQLGVWLRDSMAGIGTMTFYDPSSGIFAALGHGINDVDTSMLMPLESGSIMPATVSDVKKGISGQPGELHGSFDLTRDLGSLYANTARGIFGHLTEKDITSDLKPVAIAHREQVRKGPAEILSNVQGNEVKAYSIQITDVNSSGDGTRSLVLQVTDPELLESTGGIVQGMSGSPIIQDGKIVGAVTHVLVNDPTRGYGIFIENMLEAAE